MFCRKKALKILSWILLGPASNQLLGENKGSCSPGYSRLLVLQDEGFIYLFILWQLKHWRIWKGWHRFRGPRGPEKLQSVRLTDWTHLCMQFLRSRNNFSEPERTPLHASAWAGPLKQLQGLCLNSFNVAFQYAYCLRATQLFLLSIRSIRISQYKHPSEIFVPDLTRSWAKNYEIKYLLRSLEKHVDFCLWAL